MFKVDLDDVYNILSEGVDSLEKVEDEDEELTEEEEKKKEENDELIAEELIKECLNCEELSEFLQNKTEIDALINQGILSERSIVRLDKYAKLNRYESQAVLAIAREKNDRDFKKLLTIWKMRKFLLNKLNKKYGPQAKTRARQNMKKVKKTNTGIAAKILKK